MSNDLDGHVILVMSVGRGQFFVAREECQLSLTWWEKISFQVLELSLPAILSTVGRTL